MGNNAQIDQRGWPQRRSLRVRVVAMAAVSLIAASCAGGSSSPATESTNDGDAAASETAEGAPSGTLTFGNWQWLVEGRGDDLWTAVSGYEDYNSEASLEQEATPFGDYADTLNTRLGSGVGPDVFIVLDDQFFVLADAGLLEPLDEAVVDAPLNESNEEMVVDGQRLGVTWEQVPYALLGNKNVMEEAGIDEMPTNLDELIEAGEMVQENTSADGFAVRHRIAEFAGWAADFPNWVYGQGGSWSEDGQLTIDADENIEGVTEFKRVYDSGIMPIGDDGSTFRSKFKENSLGFIIDNGGAALSFTSGGQITGQDMVAAPLPFAEGGSHQKLILAVNASSENKELAKDFVKWFVSEEGQELVRTPIGANTLATDMPLPDEFVEEHPWATTYIEAGKRSKSSLVPGHETESTDYYQSILEAVERVITQDEDPRAALEGVQAELQ